jgi:hypothetical protein
LDPGQIHSVLLKNLKPDTTYYYRYGDDTHQMSDIYQFKAPVFHGNSTRIVAMGDMGTYFCEKMDYFCTNSEGITNDISKRLTRNEKIDMVLHIGDIAYALGKLVKWDQFFYQIEPISRSIPWMVTIGNHEYDYLSQPFKPDWSNYGGDSHGECGVPFSYKFQMPNNNQFWWSINYGNVHFVLWSAEHDFTQHSEQWNWIKNDLENVDRKVTPFVIMGGHRPMYSSGNISRGDYIMSLHIQDEVEELLYKYKVDLAIWGHYHSYERTCPVYKQHCVENGTIHAVIGMAGASLILDWMPKPEWSLFRDSSHFGYTIIESDKNNLHFQYYATGNLDSPLDQIHIKSKY